MSRENGAELHFSWAHSNYYSEITLEKVTARHYTRVLKQSVLKVAIMRGTNLQRKLLGKITLLLKHFAALQRHSLIKGMVNFVIY